MGTTISNRHKLPDSIVNAVMVDKHKVHGDISCTQLLDAPQIRVLKRKHSIEQDAMDMMWALLGNAVHHILELGEIHISEPRKLIEAAGIIEDHNDEKGNGAAKWIRKFAKKKYPYAKNPNLLTEVTLSMDILGKKISGTFDRFNTKTGVVQDYKVCSTWAYIFKESLQKFYAQQNTYAHMLRAEGHEVNKLQLILIFRDWSESAKLRNQDYPAQPVMVVDVPIWDPEKVQKALEKRVKLHTRAEEGDMPPCTGKERWASADTYAVTTSGRKRAIRVVSQKQFAEQFITENSKKYEDMIIETRKGENKRCEKYCPVSEHCEQFKAIKAKEKEKKK